MVVWGFGVCGYSTVTVQRKHGLEILLIAVAADDDDDHDDDEYDNTTTSPWINPICNACPPCSLS